MEEDWRRIDPRGVWFLFPLSKSVSYHHRLVLVSLQFQSGSLLLSGLYFRPLMDLRLLIQSYGSVLAVTKPRSSLGSLHMNSVLMALSHVAWLYSGLVTIRKVMYSSDHRFVFVQGMNTEDDCSYCDEAGDVTRGLIIYVWNSVASCWAGRKTAVYWPHSEAAVWAVPFHKHQRKLHHLRWW